MKVSADMANEIATAHDAERSTMKRLIESGLTEDQKDMVEVLVRLAEQYGYFTCYRRRLKVREAIDGEKVHKNRKGRSNLCGQCTDAGREHQEISVS